jgi:hypothetical protein
MFTTMEGQKNGIFWWSLPRDYNWEDWIEAHLTSLYFVKTAFSSGLERFSVKPFLENVSSGIHLISYEKRYINCATFEI